MQPSRQSDCSPCRRRSHSRRPPSRTRPSRRRRTPRHRRRPTRSTESCLGCSSRACQILGAGMGAVELDGVLPPAIFGTFLARDEVPPCFGSGSRLPSEHSEFASRSLHSRNNASWWDRWPYCVLLNGFWKTARGQALLHGRPDSPPRLQKEPPMSTSAPHTPRIHVFNSVSIRTVLAITTALITLGVPAHAAETTLTVSVFQGMQNLPLFAAQQKGFFAKRGLSVVMKIAPSSVEQRRGLADGAYQIIHSGVDNGVAMAEVAKVDIAVVMGGDNGFNRLIAQPDINTISDLRGKTLIVDAPDTAYAFQLYEILARNGLNKGDYQVKSVGAAFKRLDDIEQNTEDKATVINPPYVFTAEHSGRKDLGGVVALIGPYQATAGIVQRFWAAAHPDTLVKYMQAYIEGLRYVLDSKNQVETIQMLAEGLHLPADLAAVTYDVAVDPVDGLARDAHLDGPGFDNVLRLRAQWTGVAPGPATKYLDLSYYDKALATL